MVATAHIADASRHHIGTGTQPALGGPRGGQSGGTGGQNGTGPGAPGGGSEGGSGNCQVNASLVPNCGVLWGVAPGAFTGVAPTVALANWENASGRTADIFHVYHRGDEKFPTAAEIAKADQPGHKRLLLINWKVAAGTTWAAVAAGKEDGRIDAEAAYLKSHFTEKFFLAVHHEPENDVNQTAGSGMTAKDYAAMYRHTILRLRADGVTNAVSVIVFMGYEGWCEQPWFKDLWPGDDVVDWIAEDPYETAKPGAYAFGPFSKEVNGTHKPASFAGFYTWATTTHPGHPIMLAEWGVFEYTPDPSQKAWIYSTVADDLGKFPMLKAIVYFDSPNCPKGDSRINSSSQSIAAFRSLAADSVFDVDVGTASSS